MDCSNMGNSGCSCRRCRPQRPVPPNMNTDCGCGGNIQTPMWQQVPTEQPTGNAVPGSLPMQPNQQQTDNGNTSLLPNYQGRFMADTGGSQNVVLRPGNMSGMPIGLGYVPWQRWGQTYPLSQGFERGTIFPELDMPFVMGRCR